MADSKNDDLTQDPLIQWFEKTNEYIQSNKTSIIGVAVAIVVFTGSIIGYSFYSSSQEEQAQQLLSIAEGYYAEGDYQKALDGDSFELTYGFRAIATDFSGTYAGNLASYYSAISAYQLGNIEQAIRYIESFEVPEGILGVGAKNLHAKLYLANGDMESAAKTFETAARWDNNEATTPDNLLSAAGLYAELGNTTKAADLVEEILTQFPSSSQESRAEFLKGNLAIQ
ncbi:soluble NSF attachment family protein [Bacteroidota bacterium]|nr:soluble NSF attachment family protein [Bacteroidota bacterium]